MRTGNVMIGAVAKRISSKFNEGDRVKIAKEYGGGTGKVVDVVGSFVVVKTKNGNESYHSSDLKVINGIGAVKSGKIRFDGKRVFYQDEKGDDLIAYISSYMTLTSNPGLSDTVTKKLNSFAKRKGFKIKKD